MDDQTKIQLEAAAFRGLVAHLQQRNDVQNIDMMNLAGFCRNCLYKWYKAAANKQNIELGVDEVKEMIYGMPYDDWKDKYQHKATQEQKEKYSDKTGHAVIEGV